VASPIGAERPTAGCTWWTAPRFERCPRGAARHDLRRVVFEVVSRSEELASLRALGSWKPLQTGFPRRALRALSRQRPARRSPGSGRRRPACRRAYGNVAIARSRAAGAMCLVPLRCPPSSNSISVPRYSEVVATKPPYVARLNEPYDVGTV